MVWGEGFVWFCFFKKLVLACLILPIGKCPYLLFFCTSLHRHLVEHLNAEIVLHTVTDVSVALEWIRSTFLYIRALKNPTHYGSFGFIFLIHIIMTLGYFMSMLLVSIISLWTVIS